jgi:Restriction endonuclease S subunits
VNNVPLEAVLLSLESGARPKGGVSADSGDIPSIGGEHLTDDGNFDFSNIKRIPISFYKKMKSGHICPFDILIVKDGATTGKTSFVHPNFPFKEAAVNEHIFCVRVNPEKALPAYICHFLRSVEGQKSILRDFRGATVGGISREFATKVILPLPSLPEQHRIVDILDRAEALRAKRRASLDQLDDLTQDIFINMFGGHAMKEWPVTTIASLAHPGKGSIRTGPFGSQLLHSEFVDEGIAVLGIDNAVANEFQWGARRFISEAKYKELKRYTVRPGDVLITIMGTCGRCAIVPDDIPIAINTKHLCCITLDQEKCIPTYLHAYFLRHPIAQRYLAQTAKGAIMAGLNMEIIKKMPIPLPPLLFQKDFAHHVEAINKLKTEYKASLADLDELFASLQCRAFRRNCN